MTLEMDHQERLRLLRLIEEIRAELQVMKKESEWHAFYL